jgi:glyoxylase-like metal-dependent hydrolase (beta-lactamase superfamily II)
MRGSDSITAIDAGYVRPKMAAIHAIEHRGRVALVDTGTAHSVPRTLEALAALGHGPGDVDYVLLTHVHLDHAGGAGAFMWALPNATLVVHPRGAPHMIDPAKLVAASIAVYGEALYRDLYGEIPPIDAARVHATQDGEQLSLAGRVLEFWFTPGHAMHHQAIVDHASHTIFTGDTFGLSYREFDTVRGAFIFPTTTPTQFDPQQLEASVARIAAYRPRAVHLTHYARVEDVERLAEDMTLQVRAFAAIAQRHAGAADRHARIRADMRALLRERSLAHGCTMDEAQFDALVAADLDLNADGLLAWLERRGRA